MQYWVRIKRPLKLSLAFTGDDLFDFCLFIGSNPSFLTDTLLWHLMIYLIFGFLHISPAHLALERVSGPQPSIKDLEKKRHWPIPQPSSLNSTLYSSNSRINLHVIIRYFCIYGRSFQKHDMWNLFALIF